MRKAKRGETIVNVAKLKNELSKYLALTKKGQEVTVLEHKMPIAKVVPYPTEKPPVWKIREPIRPLNLDKWLQAKVIKRNWDPVDLLLEDRKKR